MNEKQIAGVMFSDELSRGPDAPYPNDMQSPKGADSSPENDIESAEAGG